MEPKQVKRLAARVLGVGEKRIRIRDLEKAQQAMTGDDVRALMKQGAIEVLQKKGVSRVGPKRYQNKRKKDLEKAKVKEKEAPKAGHPKKKNG